MASAGKRILMLLENNSFPGDVRVRREAGSLVKFGYEVTVIAPRDDDEPWYAMEDSVRVYRYPQPREGESALGYLWEYGWSLAATWVLTLWVFLRHGFDAIHSHTPPDLYVLIAICYWPLRKPYVFDLHDISPEMYVARFQGKGNPWVIKALTFFEGLSCRYASQIITVNESYRDLIVARHGLDAGKVTVVRNGPCLDSLHLVAPDEEMLAKHANVFGYVGIMGFQDGVDSLIRALHELKSTLNRDDFYCVLIGRGSSVDYLKQLVSELDLTEQVLFTGFVSHADLLKYLSTAHICVAPDPYNPFNDRSTMIKMMEYMTLAKPIVCYRLVEHQVTAKDAALYAEVSSELDFARQLQRLMDDRLLQEKMGRAGRDRIETVLAWKHQEEHLRDVYLQLFGP